MGRFFQIVMILCAGLLALGTGTFLYVRIKYPPEKLKAMALAEIGTKLHRETRVEEVSLSLFQGLKLIGFKLSERPSFSQGTFIECGSFHLRPSLLPLLKGHLAVSRLVLDSPVIRIVRNKDKTFNFSDLLGGESAPPAKNSRPSGGAAPVLLTVDRISIRNGQVLFLDRSDGSDARLENLALSISNFSTVRPFPVRFSVSIHLKQGETDLSTLLTFLGNVSLPFGLQGAFSAPSIAQTSYEGRDLKVQCNLKGGAAELGRIEGSAELSMNQGEIHPGPFIKALAAVIDPSLSRLTYDSLKARILFNKGTVRVQNGELHGSFDILANGTYTTATNALDFLLKMKVRKTSLIPWVGWNYSVPVDISIGGTPDHPTCRLKTTQMIRGVIHGIKERTVGTVKDILKNSLDEIFNAR
jgi:hypothetical protein